jgi:hypothetical protein
MKFNLNKPFELKGGLLYTIHTMDNGKDPGYPIVGEVQLTPNNWVVTKWKTDGTCYLADKQLNLYNPQPVVKAIVALLQDSKTQEVYALGAFANLYDLKDYITFNHRGSTIIGTSMVELKEGEFVKNAGNSSI